MGLTFKQFLELVEKPQGHLDALRDLGVKPDSFKDIPQWGSFPQFGPYTYNGSPYKILGWVYGKDGHPTHAKIQLINLKGTTRRRYKTQGDKQVEIPDDNKDNADNRVYIVPLTGTDDKKDPGAEDLMTQTWKQMAAGGGGEPQMMQ